MNARNQILTKLRQQIVDKVPLPDALQGEWIRFENPVDQFRQMVEAAGGACTELASVGEISQRLKSFSEWQSAERIFSKVPAVDGNVDLDLVDDPHDLENLDFVVYPGQFAVAENGAIWLTDRDLKHRLVFFITQFLILVVSKETVLHNMHEAYARAETPVPGFGLFLSGPSKTADIEQSLVIGAHGCRELQVFLV